MSYFTTLLISVLAITAYGAQANNTYDFSGKIIDEQGAALDNVQITLNDASFESSDSGAFHFNLPAQKMLQFTFKKQGYYPSVQSFSRYELTTNKFENVFDNITLVKKKTGRVMLAFGGDVMMGRRFYKPYFGDEVLINYETNLTDSKSILAAVKPYMSIADYAAVNLETQIAEQAPKERAKKSVTFYSQPELLAALTWAGVDYVSLGNNHTYDYLEEGLVSTLKHLEQSELDYSGAGLDEQDALKAHRQRINDQAFSMLGYVGWEGSTTPTQSATAKHGGAAYGSMENIVASVSKEVEKNQTTIVQYHGSQEYSDGPTGVTEQRLKSSIDSGAALAIAHHPHVAQGLELYNGNLIAYSMGNFTFDQNFSSTQHSFILYVWLDEGAFTRAEIVPIYLKGYQPTPATGMHRYSTMKRLKELSALRYTNITQSGGHGVITADNQAKKSDKLAQQVSFPVGTTVASLHHLPWHKSLAQVGLPNEQIAYRLGTNLINGSDFESFDNFSNAERGWLFDREKIAVNDFGASGTTSLSLTLDKTPSIFGMQSFRRVYKASSPMTIKAKFKVDKGVKVNFYWQGRKTRQKLFDAFKNGKKNLIQSVTLGNSKQWQSVEIDFNSPRIGYRSYRVLAEFIAADGTQTQIDIDDFALIEWQTAYSKSEQPNFFNLNAKQASFIGLDRPVNSPIKLTLH
ncbi:CapA family protein [Thalassotalea atypica]|uniref:CapA family protein n=1 Tax=Thalassotalea atypica TaxID=2054316 RepID=UPI002572E8F5|nr:CapA family protein [Thalassotalea atypica]